MKTVDLMGMGLTNVKRRKARTFLTMLGVIIGIVSIVIMLSISVGVKGVVLEQFSSFGQMNVINVFKPYENYGQSGRTTHTQQKLDDKAVKELKRIEHVQGVMPEIETQAKFISGRYEANISIKGINPEEAELFGFEIEQGRMLRKDEEFSIIFGSEIPYFFYNPKGRNDGMYYGIDEERPKPKVNVLKDRMTMTFDMQYGQPNQNASEIHYEEYKIRGVGILKENYANNSTYAVFMDMDQLKKLIEEKERAEGIRLSETLTRRGYDRLSVFVDGTQNVEEVQNQIKELGYEAYSMADSLKGINQFFVIMQSVLGGIGGISLLIAAIGITNTMTMAIYERTKEIGIMKVLGCELKDIKRLFLFEAGTISAMGGVVGLLISYGFSAIINLVAKTIIDGQTGPGADPFNMNVSIVPWWLALSALIFATVMGVISGLYPAKRAMKLSALASIKNE